MSFQNNPIIGFHMTSRPPCWCPKQRKGGHVGAPTQSSGNLTLLLCKRFLLFSLKNMAVDHVNICNDVDYLELLDVQNIQDNGNIQNNRERLKGKMTKDLCTFNCNYVFSTRGKMLQIPLSQKKALNIYNSIDFEHEN